MSFDSTRLEVALRAKRQLKPLNQRSAEERAAAEAADSNTHQKLKRLLRSKGNQKCADCQAQYSGWAALPHGVFLCIDCAQLHRGIGRHISQVKAINTGTYLWYKDEVDVMVANGNELANAVLLARHPRGAGASVPTRGSHADRVAFLRDKYERRCWAIDVRDIPTEKQEASDDSVVVVGPEDGDRLGAEETQQTAVPRDRADVSECGDQPGRKIRVLHARARRRSPLRVQKLPAETDLISLECPWQDTKPSVLVENSIVDRALNPECENGDLQKAADVNEGQIASGEGAYDAKVSQIMALYRQPVQRGMDGHLQFTRGSTVPPESFFEQYGL